MISAMVPTVIVRLLWSQMQSLIAGEAFNLGLGLHARVAVTLLQTFNEAIAIIADPLQILVRNIIPFHADGPADSTPCGEIFDALHWLNLQRSLWFGTNARSRSQFL